MVMVTDDAVTTKVSLIDGKVYSASTKGCSETEPFKTMETEIMRLEGMYVMFGAVGGDRGTDADAHD